MRVTYSLIVNQVEPRFHNLNWYFCIERRRVHLNMALVHIVIWQWLGLIERPALQSWRE